MAIVKANYTRRGGTKATAAKAAQRAAKYYTYRDGPDRNERRWYVSDGRVSHYDDIQAELYADAKQYGYMYRIVLSTKDADIGPDGYAAALGDRFEKYYFIEHHNTDHPHAHVIGFRKATLKKDDLQLMRGEVARLEHVQRQQRDRSRSRDHAYGLG